MYPAIRPCFDIQFHDHLLPTDKACSYRQIRLGTLRLRACSSGSAHPSLLRRGASIALIPINFLKFFAAAFTAWRGRGAAYRCRRLSCEVVGSIVAHAIDEESRRTVDAAAYPTTKSLRTLPANCLFASALRKSDSGMPSISQKRPYAPANSALFRRLARHSGAPD